MTYHYGLVLRYSRDINMRVVHGIRICNRNMTMPTLGIIALSVLVSAFVHWIAGVTVLAIGLCALHIWASRHTVTAMSQDDLKSLDSRYVAAMSTYVQRSRIGSRKSILLDMDTAHQATRTWLEHHAHPTRTTADALNEVVTRMEGTIETEWAEHWKRQTEQPIREAQCKEERLSERQSRQASRLLD